MYIYHLHVLELEFDFSWRCAVTHRVGGYGDARVGGAVEAFRLHA